MTTTIKSLLDNVGEVKTTTIGEICKIETGRQNANAMVDGGNYHFFTCSKDIFKINTYRWDTEAIMIAGNGYLGLVHYFNGKFDAYQRTYVLTNFNNKIIAKYIYYCLLSNFKNYVEQRQNEASVPYIKLKDIQDFPIPLPPLPTQHKRVEILDKFTELQTELQTELKLRKKQYEYYRDKLLTFSEEERERERDGELL